MRLLAGPLSLPARPIASTPSLHDSHARIQRPLTGSVAPALLAAPQPKFCYYEAFASVQTAALVAVDVFGYVVGLYYTVSKHNTHV